MQGLDALVVLVDPVPGVDLDEHKQTPSHCERHHHDFEAQLLLQVLAGNEEARKGHHDHDEAEGDPLLEEARLDLFRITADRLALEVHLMEGLIDALLSCILDTCQPCLAENGLEGEQNPQTVEFLLLRLLLNRLGRLSQSNGLCRLQVLTDVGQDPGRNGFYPRLAGRYRLISLHFERDVVYRLLARDAKRFPADLVAVDIDRFGQFVQVLVPHILDRVQRACSSRCLVVDTADTQSKVTRRLNLVLTVTQRPHLHHVAVLAVVKAVLRALDDLVLLHLRQPLDLIALVLAEDAPSDALSTRCRACIVRHLPVGILVLTVALHTLHIKVAPIEAIRQIIDIVQQVALSSA